MLTDGHFISRHLSSQYLYQQLQVRVIRVSGQNCGSVSCLVWCERPLLSKQSVKRSGAGAGESPVELIDVLDIAEQSADLLWLQRQRSTVDDAAQVVLQREDRRLRPHGPLR